MTTTYSARQRQALTACLVAQDYVHDPQWMEAVQAIPREVFLGEAVFRRVDTEQGTLWEPVRRADLGDEQWAEMAYSNETWVTQVDGVTGAPSMQPPRTVGRP